VRYAVEDLGKKRLAVIYQTTAYGQGGRDTIRAVAAGLGVEIVFEQGIDTDVKDMLPVLSQVRSARADALLIHLHAGSTALLVRQAAAMGLGLPLIAGSAMHQPATAALLEPAELKGVCAEAGSSPASGGSPAADKFLAEYRAAFGTDPDAYALGQFDGTNMLLDVLARGAATPEAVRRALSETTYQGIAGRYASDGKGNMAHSVVILCYDGTSRTPHIVRRYDGLQTAAKP
jgi:branched-chain amino acid transport system substrate-binding protein